MTNLAVYQAWANAKFSNPWCFENFIQARTMRRAQDVRKQLLAIMDRYKLEISTCGKNFTKVRKAITSGFFMHAAKKDPQEGYKTMDEGQVVYIHPSSALFNRNPEWLIYHELVLTTKEYMREIVQIEPKWLIELAPRFFQTSNPAHLSKRKRQERIEPLYDRFNVRRRCHSNRPHGLPARCAWAEMRADLWLRRTPTLGVSPSGGAERQPSCDAQRSLSPRRMAWAGCTGGGECGLRPTHRVAVCAPTSSCWMETVRGRRCKACFQSSRAHGRTA